MSLRARVTLAFTAMLAVVLAAAGAFLYVRFADDLHETQDEGLRSRAAQLADAVERGDVGDRLPDAPGIEEDEAVAQVLGRDGTVRAANAAVPEPLLSREQLAAARAGSRFFDRPEDERVDEHLRLLAVPAGDSVAVVGASREEVDESAQTLLLLEGLSLGVALLAGAAGAWVLAGAVVRPVTAALERERRLVADASHELRTPLAVLRSELEVTRMEGAGEGELRAALASAEEEVERLSRLTDDLLVLARADEHGLALKESEVELDTLLERAARGASGVEVEPSGLRVRGDDLRLEQVVRNLIDNAVRHGAPPVRVSASAGVDGVSVAVRDHGEGVAPEIAERAFDRFVRADAARGRGGAGLGLAIASEIARAHGGSVRLTPASPGTLAELLLPHRSLIRGASD